MPDAPDPSQQSADSIRQSLSEPEPGGAEAVDFGEGESGKSTTEYLTEAFGHLVEATQATKARANAATGELAVGEVAGGIERGVDPSEALAVGRSSGLIPEEQLDELAWQAAVAEQGMTPEEYDELASDDPYADDELDVEIEQRYQEILGESKGLAEVEQEYVQADRQQQATLKQQVANHQQSVGLMQTYAAELGLSKSEWEAHLQDVDQLLEAGGLGQPTNLDVAAASNPAAFDRLLRAGSAMLRQAGDEYDAAGLKAGILLQQNDIADGLVVDGVPVKGIEPDPLLPDQEKFADGVAARALTRPQRKIGDVLSAPRPSVRDGFTVDGRPTHVDDVPSPDGSTARSRWKEEQRRAR